MTTYQTTIAIIMVVATAGVVIYLMPIWKHSKDWGYTRASRASIVLSLLITMVLIAWFQGRQGGP